MADSSSFWDDSWVGPGRQQGESAILVGLPQNYLESTFRSYGLKSPSGSAPDITVGLEIENEKEL